MASIGPTTDDALAYVIRYLRTPQNDGSWHLNHDLTVDSVIRRYMATELTSEVPSIGPRGQQIAMTQQLWPIFQAAAWELCRRGITYPGSKTSGDNQPGYSLTPAGRAWLAQLDEERMNIVIPSRFMEFLSANAQRWGRGYASRGREALVCYNAMAYPACCAMCGAAAESILLALAIEISGDEQKCIDTYSRRGGRAEILKLLRLDNKKQQVRDEFNGYLDLILDWRDEASHGRDITASEGQAFTSLLMLMRLSKFAGQIFT